LRAITGSLDAGKRHDGGDVDEASRQKGRPRPEFRQHEPPRRRPHDAGKGAQHFALGHLASSHLGIAKGREAGMIRGPIEHFPERSDQAEQPKRHPDAVHESQYGKRKGEQKRSDHQRAPQPDGGRHHQDQRPQHEAQRQRRGEDQIDFRQRKADAQEKDT
jgi:hypothetical protein